MEDKNFEKYFKEQFGKNVPSQPWNTPSNSVWQNIEDKLSSKKNRIGFLPLFLLGLLLFLVPMSLLFLNISNKNKLIDNLQFELQACNDINGPQPLQSDVVLPLSSEIEVESQDQNVEGNGVFVTSTQKAVKKTKLTETRRAYKSNDNSSLSNGSQALKKFQESGDSFFDSSSMGPAYDQEIVTRVGPSTYLLDPLGGINFNPLSSTKEVTFTNLEINNVELEDKKDKVDRKLEIGLSYGMAIWQSRNKGQLNNPLNEILISERISNSQVYGLGLNYKWNNQWLVHSGIHYFEKQLTSQYSVNLPYDKRLEISNGQEFDNTFDHSLPTGWGDVNTTLILSRSSSSQIPTNDTIPIDMTIHHRLQSFELPLTIQYFPWGVDKGFYISKGVSLEWIWSSGNTSMIANSHHPIIKDKLTHSNYESKQINKWLLSGVATAGWRKNVAPQIHLNLMAGYNYGLNPLIKNGNYSQTINRIGASATVLYSLR